jgi:ketosteroid isomerase-like protein
MQSSQLSQVETGEQPVNAARGPNQGPALQIAHELSSAAAFFTREGCLITPDGTAVHGRPNIAGVLVQLTARHTQIEVEQVVVQGAGDVAFASGRLTMRSDGPDGSRFAQSCDLNLVLRRIEGKWKIAILAPWGTC